MYRGYTHVSQPLCHVHPLLLHPPLPVCCCGDDEPLQAGSEMQPSFFFFLFFFFFNVETEKIGVVKQSLVSHRERQLPAVGNQWSFLQINSIQLWSTAHCRFLDVGFWKLDLSDWNTESFAIQFLLTCFFVFVFFSHLICFVKSDSTGHPKAVKQ